MQEIVVTSENRSFRNNGETLQDMDEWYSYGKGIWHRRRQRSRLVFRMGRNARRMMRNRDERQHRGQELDAASSWTQQYHGCMSDREKAKRDRKISLIESRPLRLHCCTSSNRPTFTINGFRASNAHIAHFLNFHTYVVPCVPFLMA